MRKEDYPPVITYQKEILRLLKAAWKLRDLKFWIDVYTFLAVYARQRGIN